ncbi:hypothetical protein CTI12_AA530320 [Artemisia annua]|uniref:Uncharacterized protein n=1 Tax=Artemisia annua TaxID=35608 RepID=A0A2U1L4T4_ARTAN|nr:hypothetical protein CTI12_AA530320 [Artemisia annua]
MSTSQATLYSQVFERVKDALSKEPQAFKHKPILVDQEKAFESNITFQPHQPFSSSHETSSHESPLIQPVQTFNAPTFPSVPCISSNLNLSPAQDSSYITKANLQSTSYTLKSKSNKASECHAICSKALRFAKILQDKKSTSKNKERDTRKISGRIKKKGKSRARKNNINYEGDGDQLCSLSQGDSDDDESMSLYSLGASLGITLDGKPARSKNDEFSDFLVELSNNDRPLTPL